jgi:hypothetical protein
VIEEKVRAIMFEAAKAAAEDLRELLGDEYEATLIGVVPLLVASKETPLGFMMKTIKGFGPDANHSLKALLLAFLWEAVFENLPALAGILKLYESLKPRFIEQDLMAYALLKDGGMALMEVGHE